MLIDNLLDEFLNLRQLVPIYVIVVTILLTISCSITLLVPYNICSIIPALTTYGKAADELERHSFLYLISVPKRWFQHFYIIGALNLVFCIQTIHSISTSTIQHQTVIQEFLTTLTVSQRNPPITFSSGVLAISLITLHVFRRLYETLFVTVYSDSRMNWFHYILGLLHYIILPFSIMCDTQGIVNGHFTLKLNQITIEQWIGSLVFTFCNWQQHKMTEKIANTRKCSRGLIRNYAYGICFGGWFNYVSCPHFLFEILIYVSLLLVIPTAYSYKFIVLFVFVNQMFAAQITHQWYQKTFPKYPKNRKSLIPYLL